MRISFYAICTSVFSRMIARCRVTRPPSQQPSRPFPALASASEIGKGWLGPRVNQTLCEASLCHPSPLPTVNTRPRRIRDTTVSFCDAIPPTDTATPAGRRRIFPDRTACISARYTRLFHNHSLLSRRHRHYYLQPLMYEYHEAGTPYRRRRRHPTYTHAHTWLHHIFLLVEQYRGLGPLQHNLIVGPGHQLFSLSAVLVLRKYCFT